jgi:hypothetical protein
MSNTDRITQEILEQLSRETARLSKQDYADVLLALREELEVLHRCVLDELKDEDPT